MKGRKWTHTYSSMHCKRDFRQYFSEARQKRNYSHCYRATEIANNRCKQFCHHSFETSSPKLITIMRFQHPVVRNGCHVPIPGGKLAMRRVTLLFFLPFSQNRLRIWFLFYIRARMEAFRNVLLLILWKMDLHIMILIDHQQGKVTVFSV